MVVARLTVDAEQKQDTERAITQHPLMGVMPVMGTQVTAGAVPVMTVKVDISHDYYSVWVSNLDCLSEEICHTYNRV